jgi:hypothetical protein
MAQVEVIVNDLNFQNYSGGGRLKDQKKSAIMAL